MAEKAALKVSSSIAGDPAGQGAVMPGMLSWFRWKQKTNPAAWSAPTDGQPRLPTLSEQLGITSQELRQTRLRARQLETEILDLQNERDHLKETLFTLCVHAQKAYNGGDKTVGKWTWDRKTLPSRAAIHSALLHDLTRLADQLNNQDWQVTILQKSEREMTEELKALQVRAIAAETARRKLEGELAYALGEVGLANDAHHLTQRKTEYLYEELQKLSPHFKNLSAEKVAAKAAKDALKAATTPAKAPVINPPTGPEVWPTKPKL